MEFKIAVCDDCEKELEQEIKTIKNVLDRTGLKGKITSFSEPEKLIKCGEEYNVVFLDIDMGYPGGLQTAEILKSRNKNCYVFFVTNYETFLDEAFNKHAFRYWIKPMDENKLTYAFEFIKHEFEKSKIRLNVKTASGTLEICPDKIIYFYVMNRILRIVTENGELAVKNTYRVVKDTLRGSMDFFEISRGCCVNFKYVRGNTKKELYCSGNGKQYRLDISRRNYSNFNRSFTKWLGGAV